METAALKSEFLLRFDSFELSRNTRELRLHGVKVRLQGQPLDVLLMLLEQPGAVLTREELQRKLWPHDTFVDFEHGLNCAINRLRAVLGDDSEEPRYIETLPRLGYRFVAPVETKFSGNVDPALTDVVAASANAPEVQPSAVSAANPSFWHRHRLSPLLAASGVLFLASAASLLYIHQPLPPPRITETVRLTNDPNSNKRVLGTDGVRIYLSMASPVAVGELAVSGGDISEIPINVPNYKPEVNWIERTSPDGSSFLFWGPYDPKDHLGEIWTQGTSGAPVRFLARGREARWSADGKFVIYMTHQWNIYTIPNSGGEPRLLRKLDGPEYPFGFTFSPDGRTIRFNRGYSMLWEMSSDGTNLHEILPGWHTFAEKVNGCWTPDGDFFLFLSPAETPDGAVKQVDQLWALDERRAGLRRPVARPIQLTFGPTGWKTLIPSRDGQRIFSSGFTFRGELVRYNRRTKRIEPYFGGKSAEMMDFFSNGRYVIYSSFPDGVLWRANSDGTGAQEIAKAHVYPVGPRWSPDGTRIVFVDYDLMPNSPNPHPVEKIFLVPAKGGAPIRALPEDKDRESDPSWSPDGTQLVFWSPPDDAHFKPAEAKAKTDMRIVDLATRRLTYLPPAPKPA